MTSQNSKILKYTVEKAEKEKNTFKRILFRCQMVIESPDPPPRSRPRSGTRPSHGRAHDGHFDGAHRCADAGMLQRRQLLRGRVRRMG